MATQVTIEARARATSGKGAARALRRSGRVPGVIYGHNRAAESVELDAKALERALLGISSSAVVDVTLDGKAPVKALIREVQRHPLRRTDILHIDLYEVRADEKVRVTVPVHLTGTAEGVRTHGAVLDWSLHTLDIECFPQDIPEHIELDVTDLGVGQALHVGDVTLPKLRILNAPELAIASVMHARVEEAAAGEPSAAPAEPELIRRAKPEESEEA